MLEEAFIGHSEGHHAFLLTQMLERVDATQAGVRPINGCFYVVKPVSRSRSTA